MREVLDIVYLGRSHFLRSRANLIQTVHMVNAWHRLGKRIRLYMPTVGRCDVRGRLAELGVNSDLDVRLTPLLKSQWQFGTFIRVHRRELSSARVVYTRIPEISNRLGRAGVIHHLEVHDTAEAAAKGYLKAIIANHRREVLQWIFPISRSALETLASHGAIPERMAVAPSGFDLEAYANVPALDPARLDRPRSVYLGRVTHDRGLEVFASLARSGEVRLTLVGDQDEQAEAPMRTIAFVPPRDVPMWYAQCDIVLLPYQPNLAHAASISPIKLFEAMAAGRPIIASDLPAIREIIRHEQNGLLVDHADVDQWIAAIRRLKSDRPFAASLATAAREDSRKYSWTMRAQAICSRCFDDAAAQTVTGGAAPR